MTSSLDYQPPKNILEVLRDLEYDKPLEPGDKRRVDTQEARGSQKTMSRLARKFGYLAEGNRFEPPLQKHVLFFGHVGSGKTTELKSYAQQFENSGRFFPVEVDVAEELDRHNLQYTDLLMAMTRALIDRLGEKGVSLPADALEKLENWFAEKVVSRSASKELSAALEGGAEAKHGIPFVANLFARFSSAFKTNATYKEELRQVIRNGFKAFAETFNYLIHQAHEALAEKTGQARVRILFIIDGTDKLRDEDTKRLFISDVELLLAVEAFVVYTAPITLKSQDGLTGKLDTTLTLPMIKTTEQNGDSYPLGRAVLRDILLRRADHSLFASEAEIDRLVEFCGGHPRELLRLLSLCCEFADDKIDAAAVEQAINQLAAEHRYRLTKEDYLALATIDLDTINAGNDETVRNLLINLDLLEYNGGSWRRSHPVVRTLEGYKRAQAEVSPLS